MRMTALAQALKGGRENLGPLYKQNGPQATMGAFLCQAGESPSGGAQPGSEGTPIPASLVTGLAGGIGLAQRFSH